MTLDDLPDPPDPSVDPPALFSLKAAAMVLAFKNMIVQLRAAFANLNSVASGGAYAPSYVLGANPGAGVIVPQTANQQTSTNWYFGETDAGGKSLTKQLDSMFVSTSPIKGTMKLIKASDPTKWVMFSVIASTSNTGFRTLAVTPIDATAVNPFTVGDIILVQFTPTGAAGIPGAFPTFRVQDQKAASSYGGTSIAGTNTRVLNTVVTNTLAGASLANNQVTLPAGRYKVTGSAPCYAGTGHLAWLYNVGDNSVALQGTVEFSGTSTGYAQTRSMIVGEITLGLTTTLGIKHLIGTAQATTGLGYGVTSGVMIFTEILFEKIG